MESKATGLGPHAISGLTPEGDGAGAAEVWRILWFRRRLLLASALLGALAALGYGLLAPPLYSATAQALVDPRGRQVVANDVNPSTTAPDGGVTQVESQSKVLGSSGVLGRAAKALRLADDPEFNGSGGFAGRLAQALGYRASARVDRDMAVLTSLRRHLAIKRADKAFVIDVTATTREAEKSARIVNAILDAYVADGAEALSEAAVKASTSLAAGLEEQRGKVREAADAVAAFKARHGILEANDSVVGDQALAELAAALGTARAKTALQRAKLERLGRGEAAEAATTEAVRSATISQLRAQEAELARTRTELATELGPRHPALRKADAEKAELSRLIGRELARLKEAAENDLARAGAYEAELARRFEAMKRAKAESDRAFVGLRELERKLDARRTVYATFLQRAEETREQARIDSSNVRVISRAEAPSEKSWPPTGLLAAVAFCTGLGLAAAAALLREYLAPTVFSRVQMSEAAGVRELGVVPLDAVPAEAETAAALAAGRLGVGAGRSLLVVSAARDEVERRLAARFAVAAAAFAGRRVLFIAAAQGETAQPGLADVLRGDVDFGAAVVTDAASGIALLGGGRGRAPSRGDAAPAHALLAEAATLFDLVVIDGGALGAGAAAGVFAGAADDVVLAARLGRTRRLDVAAAREALDALGRTLSGTLLLKPSKGF